MKLASMLLRSVVIFFFRMSLGSGGFRFALGFARVGMEGPKKWAPHKGAPVINSLLPVIYQWASWIDSKGCAKRLKAKRR
jgi:hypothetical protein